MQPTLGPSTPRTALADNRRLVIAALRSADTELTRSDIGQISGLSPAATARITDALEADRLIARTEKSPSAGGRRAWRYRFTGEGRFLAGLRVQRDGCHGVLVDLNEQIVARSECLVEDGPDGDSILSVTKRCAQELVAAAEALGGVPISFGVAVPAVTDVDGRVRAGLEVGWPDVPLRAALASSVDAPVLIENDANALAYSEIGPGDTSTSLAGIVLGYGLGAGIVSQGKLLRGAHRAAGEIGYLLTKRRTLRERRGDVGDLERRLQAVVARDDLVEGMVPVDGMWALLAANDPRRTKVAAQLLDYLAMAVASLVTVVDPERVVLGDMPPDVGERVIDQLQIRLRGLLLHDPALTLARRGPDAVVLGAALLAGEQIDVQAI